MKNKSIRRKFARAITYGTVLLGLCMLCGCAGMMQQNYRVRVIDESDKPVEGALVVLQDIFMFRKHPTVKAALTDTNGIVNIRMRKTSYRADAINPDVSMEGSDSASPVLIPWSTDSTIRLNRALETSRDVNLPLYYVQRALTHEEYQRPEIYEFEKRLEARFAELKAWEEANPPPPRTHQCKLRFAPATDEASATNATTECNAHTKSNEK